MTTMARRSEDDWVEPATRAQRHANRSALLGTVAALAFVVGCATEAPARSSELETLPPRPEATADSTTGGEPATSSAPSSAATGGERASTSATEPAPEPEPPPDPTLVIVGSADSEGVLFTGPSAARLLRGEVGEAPPATWDPDAAAIAAMEAALPGWLRASGGRLGVEIADGWSHYRRYYAGVVDQGRRLIFGTYFCTYGDGWRSGRRTVYSDGGSCFFSVRYDPTARTFSGLRVHGEA